MTPPACLVLADDFTGACDTGLQFRRSGLSARVQVTAHTAAPADVLVFDTETRNLPPRAAAARVREAAARLDSCCGVTWYKKVDSTLRGPVGAEIEALLAATGRGLCLLAPALPRAGRTTRDGIHRVDGLPVHQSAAGRDPRAPVRHSRIADLLAATSHLAVAPLPLAAVRSGREAAAAALSQVARPAVIVADAETDADLETIAGAAAGLAPAPILCGCAGLAAHLPTAFGLVPGDGPADRPGRQGQWALILVGSAHPRTAAQVAVVADHLPVRPVLVGVYDDPAVVARTAAPERGAPLGSDGNPAVTILSLRPGESDPDGALQIMAAAAGHLAGRLDLGGIAVTGGTTAIALLAALDGSAVDLVEAVGTEVPLCHLADGPHRGLCLVTKGGGLGEDDVFLRAAQRLAPLLRLS